MLSNNVNLHDIVDEYIALGLLEDRREYSPEDLQRAQGITEQEASDLHFLIQRQFDPEINSVELKNIPAPTFQEYFLESIHGGFEGFTEHESIAIMKALDDLKRYYIASINQKG